MPEDSNPFRYRHLDLPPIRPGDRSQAFQPIGTPQSGPNYPERPDKSLHGRHLKDQVEAIRTEFEAENPDLEQWKERLAAFGMILEVSGAAGCALASGDLDDRKIGVKLLQEKHVRDEADVPITIAVIFVPYGGLAAFLNKIDEYMAEPAEGERRSREDLISSIETIRSASVRALWTDPPEYLPETERTAWWEVWIRRDGSGAGYSEDPLFHQFCEACEDAGLSRSKEVLVLPEQFVLLLKASLKQIGASAPLLNTLQELRKPTVHAGFFMGESKIDQQAWIDQLMPRIEWPPDEAVAVTLLDTGVNYAHPLLQRVLAEADCDAYERQRLGVDDACGHGTQMAGLALLGDLTPKFVGDRSFKLSHRLESVKLIRADQAVHDPVHYAAVTQECMDRPETWLDRPSRRRVYCLTLSSTDKLDYGRPSAWSAGLDAAILNNATTDRDSPRLVCVAAGNVDRSQVSRYPEVNFESSCHDPAQSWNAISVGAYTEKDLLWDKTFLGWKTLAEPGGLCPTSTTGLDWNRNWPIKPDIVMEGGNFARNPANLDVADTPDDLQLLTCHHRPYERLFATTGDTSAAAALAARYCAVILADNPQRWPETVRALLIHSARWTPQMTGWKPSHEWKPPSKLTKTQALRLAQKYGYGVPDLPRALKSTRSAVTLIAEEVIQPFAKERDDQGQLKQKIKGYNRHRIPIPESILNEHYDKRVRLRVTLSYYIDPNPTNPLVSSKFRYQGAGLRFEVKGKNETDAQFFARINQLEAGDPEQKGKNDSAQWLLGYDHRSRGSLHHDIWYGNAAELVAKDCIAIFPVGGWWKYRPFLGKLETSLRYSLVVSVEIEADTVDLYTPIAAQIEQPIAIES